MSKDSLNIPLEADNSLRFDMQMVSHYKENSLSGDRDVKKKRTELNHQAIAYGKSNKNGAETSTCDLRHE